MRGVESDKNMAAEYKEEINNLLSEQKELQKNMAHATSQIEEIDKKLSVLNQGASVDEILLHQATVLENADKITQLIELISDQEKIIEDAREGLIDLSPLLQKKEDLLADIAQGEATREDLEPIEANIANQEKLLSQQKTERKNLSSEASQVISGLKRKLESLEMERERLNILTPKIMDQFLMGEAETVAKEYQAHAKQAISSLTRLIALERLTVEQGERAAPIYLTGNQTQAFLPDSIINPASETENKGILFRGQNLTNLVTEAIKTERERLETLGIVAP